MNRDGLGAKTTLELNESSRKALGLGPSIGELLHVRERWATVTNDALREANVDARVDHRTLRAQGIDREPRLWIPKVAYEVERRGFYSPVAERVRAEYQAREEARLREQARPERNQNAEAGRTTATPAAQEPTVAPPSLADMQRQARENWLRVRKELAEARPEAARSQGRDDDLSR